MKGSTADEDSPKQGVTGETTPLPQTGNHINKDNLQVITKEQVTDDEFDPMSAFTGSRVDLSVGDNEVFEEEPDLGGKALCDSQTNKQLLTVSLDETVLSQALSVITDGIKSDQSHVQSSDLIDPTFDRISGIEAKASGNSLGVIKSYSLDECKVCLDSLCLVDSEQDSSCREVMTRRHPPLLNGRQTVHEFDSSSVTLDNCSICNVSKTTTRPQSLKLSSTPEISSKNYIASLLNSSFQASDALKQPESPT